jgi:hypothetical protein
MAEKEAKAEKPRPTRVAIRTDRRLMITRITMENFKSYFGLQEVGPFHKVRLNQGPTLALALDAPASRAAFISAP